VSARKASRRHYRSPAKVEHMPDREGTNSMA